MVCFKPFKTTIKRGKNTTIFSRNYIEQNKIALCKVGIQSSKPCTYKKNIMSRFKGTWIWPLNPKAKEEETSPSTLYTLVNQTREEEDDEYHSNEEDDDEQ